MNTKTTLMIATAMLALAMPAANAKFDDGAGKNGMSAKTAAGEAACQHDVKRGSIYGSKYESSFNDCVRHTGTAEKADNYTARKNMLEGNHKLQWQQGYTQ